MTKQKTCKQCIYWQRYNHIPRSLYGLCCFEPETKEQKSDRVACRYFIENK